MNQKKAKLIERLAAKLSRGENPDAVMKVKKNAVFETFKGDDGKQHKKLKKGAKFQRVLVKTGKRSIKRRLKKLYAQKKIRLTVVRNQE